MNPTPRALIACVFLAVLATGCGPMTTEPVPDIPQTVEYETVRIEYGEDDLIASTGQSALTQALVGDPSFLAALTKQTVRGTNSVIRDHFRLVEVITTFPPTRQQDNFFVWESREARDNGVNYLRFVIEDLGDETYRYVLTGGPTEETAQDLFGGEFTNFGRRDGRQQGFGKIYLDFDAIGDADPSANVTAGKVVIAFRSANLVRQVRTGFYEVVNQGAPPTSAIFEYTQFENGAGHFTYFSRANFLGDGEPLEFLGIRSAWNADLEGRAVARVSQGSLEINEVLFNECWDSNAATTYANSTPDFPDYEDGDASACVRLARPFDETPPIYRDPGNNEPQVPNAHPEEVDLGNE